MENCAPGHGILYQVASLLYHWVEYGVRLLPNLESPLHLCRRDQGFGKRGESATAGWQRDWHALDSLQHKSFIANTFKTTPVLGVREACSSDLSSRSAFASYRERWQLVGTLEKKMLWFFVRFCQVIKRKQKKKSLFTHKDFEQA